MILVMSKSSCVVPSWVSDPMEIRRTANAGVLLKLDGVSILLDGVCQEVIPYLATPPEERKGLSESWPDVLGFTHRHKDHYDPGFAADFQKQTNGVILGPADISGCNTTFAPVNIGGISIMSVESRHIGKTEDGLGHLSFILEGSVCVWFLGDASPAQWRKKNDLPCPDILMVPYAYAITPSAWELTKSLGAKTVVLLHLPEKDRDACHLWTAVHTTTQDSPGPILLIPEMGETLQISHNFCV